MIRPGRTLVLIGLMAVVSILFTACSNPLSDDALQNDDGNVTVTVDWTGPENGFVFDIALDTHSVDLDGYDLSDLAILLLDNEIELRPETWDAGGGGHHRNGTLSFPARGDDGTAMEVEDLQTIELIVQDVAGIPERSFTWTV